MENRGENLKKSPKNKREQLKLTFFKADVFRYTLLHATTGDPNVMVRRIMRTSNVDSNAVTGLEIWRQMTHRIAGSDRDAGRMKLRELKECPSSLDGAHLRICSSQW